MEDTDKGIRNNKCDSYTGKLFEDLIHDGSSSLHIYKYYLNHHILQSLLICNLHWSILPIYTIEHTLNLNLFPELYNHHQNFIFEHAHHP